MASIIDLREAIYRLYDDLAMVEHTFVLEAEQDFFRSLKATDVLALSNLLDDDFLMVDLTARVLNRSALLSALESGDLRFEEIRVLNSEVRLYGETAIVVGETEMRGLAKEQAFHAFSRYTHVYQEQEDDSFLLVSAQGTLINREAHP